MSNATTDQPAKNLTRDWQNRDHSHYLHLFTDHKDSGSKGTGIITHAKGVHITDSEGQQILDGMDEMHEQPGVLISDRIAEVFVSPMAWPCERWALR